MRAWTQEQLDLLAELWAGPTELPDVVATMRRRWPLELWNRNVICGKVHRLRLPTRRNTWKPTGRVPQVNRPKALPKPRKPRASRAKSKVQLAVLAPRPRPTSRVSGEPILANLNMWHCKWILDERSHDGFALYCAQPVDSVSTAYCSIHHRMVYSPPRRAA